MNSLSLLILNSIALGIGLAMDAFSVSIANGLAEPDMAIKKVLAFASVFGIFQGVMPLIGWTCVHYFLEAFNAFSKYIPIIALALLAYIGGKMLKEGIEAVKSENSDMPEPISGASLFGYLMIQGIATSIDALSVGFTIANYNTNEAHISALIIAVLTFIICFAGVFLGKKIGEKFAGKATIFGGIILIGIGLEIFISSLL